MKKTYKNLLVQYKGGGYDGCYWEWNYFLIDNKGKFHNLKTSGRFGIKTKTEALAICTGELEKNAYFYNVKNGKQVQAFVAESNNHHVDLIGTAVNRIYKKPLIKFECDDCGDTVSCDHENNDYPTMFHDETEYHWETKWCENCYLNHSCGYCGSCNEPEENNVDEEGHCKYCVPEQKQA